MVSKASISEVQQRADIVEIVGQFVRLKKRGSNYIANCPFHNEKTPSFSVSAAKGIYKCFGCGRGGDVVSFVMEQEKLAYIDAVRWLADYYKIALEETEKTPEQAQQYKVEESLRILNEYAAAWFQHSLNSTDEGLAVGLSYFKQRGLRQETIDHFRLGFSPEETSDAFYKAAASAGYSGELLEKSGLAKERNGGWYDAYRGRVIFPIQSNTGKVLGFGARILKTNDRAPKYINTPENELYLKSRVLYGMYQARQAIGKKDECLLVEGYLDVISLHQEGIDNVVASSGTALTEDQLRAIGQLTKNLTILYDSDAAGIKAALRGLDMALAQSFNVKLALLPAGEDPDSLVQKLGRAGFDAYLAEHRQDVLGFRLELGLKEAETDPVKKNELVNEIAESISKISKAEDFALQQHWLRQASMRLGVDEAGMVNLVNKYIRTRIETEQRLKDRSEAQEALQAPVAADGQEPDMPTALPAQNPQTAQEWQLIRVLLEYGSQPYDTYATTAEYIAATIEADLIEDPLAAEFFTLYYSQLHNGQYPEQAFFTGHAEATIRRQAALLMHHGNEISHNWKDIYGIVSLHEDRTYQYDVESTVAYFELKKNKQLLEQVIARLQTETNPDRLKLVMSSYLQLKETERAITARAGTVILKMK